MSCGCTDPCQPNNIPCTCEARINSDCVTVSGATSDCLAIGDNLLLTDYLTQMDERICEKVDSITNFIALENVGTGSQLYKGDSLLGKKQIRTVKSIDPNLVVTETADEIQLDLNIPTVDQSIIDGSTNAVSGNAVFDGLVLKAPLASPALTGTPTAPTAPVGTNTNQIATTAFVQSVSGNLQNVYNNSTVPQITTTALGAVTIQEGTGTDANNIYVGKNNAGTTTFSVSGDGNSKARFFELEENSINSETFRIYQPMALTDYWAIYGSYSTSDKGDMVFEIGDNGSPFSGTGQRFRFHYDASSAGTPKDPLIIDYNDITAEANITANSYIKTGGTSTQMLMADGSVKESQDNLQKQITTNTTLSNSDNNYTIFINNGATPITITIDSSVTLANFGVGFIQEGTGDVTFVGSGVSLSNPVGLKSKGQGYATFIERKLNTTSFFLLGDTKP